MAEMAKAYEPTQAEARWYPRWEESGCFHGEARADEEPYTIVIPPPNVTGMLTMGHVLNNTLQDILIRWQKMQGRSVCWVPGTDHAGIATQSKVEHALLEDEGLTRYDLGREAFLERVWQWKEQYGGTIIRQLRRLGCSCDWRRERFTLDEGLSKAVEDVFVRLYEKGLIYKGSRIINWCPKSQTALSDEEVIYRTENSHLWYIRYPYADGNGCLVVATTRPETMFGDTAVAVNPADERYAAAIGRQVRLPLTERTIPVIADDWVKPEFGTGAVKVTPAHDPNDYQIGLRHELPTVNVFTPDGHMNDDAGAKYAGLDRFACRQAAVADLEALGLIDKIEDYQHEVGYSERGGVAVEPRISDQWFVKMEELAKPALAAVADGRIRFYPERWVKVYNHWLENIRDWCISRQLWWGHRIPAWYCDFCGHIEVARETPTTCTVCGRHDLRRDEDVLDTWFSSWLWPFSVFDWPKDNADLDYFYPTNSLVTGPDIIFFWVARMIMAGLEFMGEVPFTDVYFTSIIRDVQGRKMSKSLGNSPDPIDVIETFGADALRFTMVYLAPVGTDIRYSNEKCELGRNFANKLWNAARFRTMQGPMGPDWADLDGLAANDLRPVDQWILARADAAVRDTTAALNAYDFHAYGLRLYEFVWNEFCDWFVEAAKSAFYGDDEARKVTVCRLYDHLISVILRLMHPAMPFVTEELYHELGFAGEGDFINEAAWPQPLSDAARDRLGLDPERVAMVAEAFDLVRAGRNLRGNYGIPGHQRIPYVLKPIDPTFQALAEADAEVLRGLLNAETVAIDPAYEPAGLCPSAVGKHGLIYLPLADIIDVAEELERLRKQQAELEGLIKGCGKKLANDNFVSRAPADVVQRERDRQAEFEEKLTHVNALIAELSAAI